MKQLVLVSITIVLLLFAGIAGDVDLCAQSRKSTDNQQKAILKRADQAYKKLNYSDASNYYEEYLQTANNENKDVLIKLADSYWRIGKYDAALSSYKQLFPTIPGKATRHVQLRIAGLYARFNDYEHASQWLYGVEGYKAKADVLSSVSELESMKKDSLSWNIELLDLNTLYHEFSPYLSDDFIYFSSNRYDGSQKKSKEEVISYDRLWKVPVKDVSTTKSIGKAFYKTNENVALVDGFKKIRYNSAPVSIDKNKHFYFSANSSISDKSGVKRLCLMEAFYTTKGRLKTKVIPFGDPKLYTVMHPAINVDGTLLILSSNKPNGVGGYDLYCAERKSIEKPWGELKPLGHNVNTMGDEVFPTITSNGILYYSSDAAPGLGGLDIFRIPLKDAISGTGSPEHLSYPINSSSDDFGWAQGATDTTGYFTSDRLGNNDIYSYNYSYKEPLKANIINNDDQRKAQDSQLGLANNLNNDDQKKVQNGQLGLVNMKNKDDQRKAQNSQLGLTNILNNDDQKKVQDGQLGLVNMKNKDDQRKIQDGQSGKVNQELNQLQDLDAKYLLSILFNSNKFNITPSNYYLTNALLKVMKKYPCLKLQIRSYTDTDGSDAFNQNLSKNRAIYTRNYLIKNGIKFSRLDTVCLGETQQLNENKNAIEKAVNRRVLFQAAPTGCNLNVDSLLSAELLVNHEKVYYKKIYVVRERGKYVVQVGAFKSNANAFALVSKLKKIIPENIYVVDENNFHNVRVGFSKSMVEAEKMAALIEAMGILN